MICPNCKNEIVGYPATSRVDNKTKICSNCGIEEAMTDFSRYNFKKMEIEFEKIIEENYPDHDKAGIGNIDGIINGVVIVGNKGYWYEYKKDHWEFVNQSGWYPIQTSSELG